MKPCDSVTISCAYWNALLKEAELAGYAKRLALELECLLTSTRDTAIQSRWWDSAHEALGQYQEAVDRLYRDDGEPTMDELANHSETRSSP